MTNYYPPATTGPTDVGPYRLVRMIGEGGMGAVYYALRRTDNLAVALKILPRSLAMDSDQLARFRREAAVAMGLDHPNVVGCIDVDQADGYNFMVMEFVGGGDAEELMRRSGGRISERRAMSITLDITKALHHASSFGLVHRDIKPENLLFTEAGLAKLTDFGLVKRTAENLRITERGKAMGTPHFMAPEQARGKRDLDVRSDIYSLGATIYYLLAGRTPYSGNTAFEIVSQLASEPPPPLLGHRPDLSPSSMFIIECMMARELEDRPQSAKDLLVMIEAYFNGRQIPHPRDLARQDKPAGEAVAQDGKNKSLEQAQNPLKVLKAVEFTQGSGKEPKRQEVPHELPANSLTRHFLTSPTRIMAKGAAPPPPPSPESVSMPSSGTKIPLIKQNADARKPAVASPVQTPNAFAPPPPPASLPLKAPPPPPQPPAAYQSTEESGEQIAAEAEEPRPAAEPSASAIRSAKASSTGRPADAPVTPAPGTITDRFGPPQAPPPEAYIDPRESGELLTGEVTPIPKLPPPASVTAPDRTPVTNRFGRAEHSSSSPPAAVPSATPSATMGPVTRHLLNSGPSSSRALPVDRGPDAPGGVPPAAPPPAQPQRGPETTAGQVPETGSFRDAEVPPPEAYIDSSDSAKPVAAAPESAPVQLEEEPPEPGASSERWSQEAFSEFSASEEPVDSAASTPPTAANPAAPAGGAVTPQTPSASGTQAASAGSADDQAPQPGLGAHPDLIQNIAMNASTASLSAIETVPPGGTPIPAITAVPPPAPSAPETAMAPPPVPSPVGLDAATQNQQPAVSPPAWPEAAQPPLPPAQSAVPATLPAETEPLILQPEPPAVATAPNQAWGSANDAPAQHNPSIAEPGVTASATAADSQATPQMGSGSDMPRRAAPAPAAPPPDSYAAAETSAGENVFDPDSLLARVRRLHEADTMSREVSAARRPSSMTVAPPATHAGAWKILVLGFVGGVIITVLTVLLVQSLH